jgi:hypothetical protein
MNLFMRQIKTTCVFRLNLHLTDNFNEGSDEIHKLFITHINVELSVKSQLFMR